MVFAAYSSLEAQHALGEIDDEQSAMLLRMKPVYEEIECEIMTLHSKMGFERAARKEDGKIQKDGFVSLKADVIVLKKVYFIHNCIF